MADCSFCGHELVPGTGTMYVKNEEKVLYFCSLKCQTNLLKHGRDARKWKYTKASRKLRQKV